MKKIRLAKTFLTVGKILSIVITALSGLLALIGLFVLFLNPYVGAILLYLGLLFALIYIPGIIMTGKALKGIKTISNKKQAINTAILCFIVGSFLEFPIVSGIMLCLTKDTDFVIDVK